MQGISSSTHTIILVIYIMVVIVLIQVLIIIRLLVVFVFFWKAFFEGSKQRAMVVACQYMLQEHVLVSDNSQPIAGLLNLVFGDQFAEIVSLDAQLIWIESRNRGMEYLQEIHRGIGLWVATIIIIIMWVMITVVDLVCCYCCSSLSSRSSGT